MAKTEPDELADLRTQLEQLRRECDRSADMTAEIIAAFGDAFRRERRLRNEANASASSGVTLEKGSVMLPLGVKDQAVAIPLSEAARRVSASVSCRDSSQVVVVRLSFGLRQVQFVREVAGETVDDANGAVRTFLVRLVAGEPKTLFELDANAETTEFALCRVGGEPCVLRLQIDGAAHAETEEGARRHGPVPFDRRHGTSSKGTLWKAQELLREGRAERAMEVAQAYAADVERPALALLRATLANDDAEWFANVNAYIGQFGIAPIRLENKCGSRFLRLTADAPRSVSGGPLVTVIMPAFNAEKTLALAATSILKQSWTELELIIIDDCSSDDTWEIAQRIARLDPRVKVLKNKTNVGPYVSKNVALSIARGAYITCHDADDWAHPQRLENQVEAMQSRGARACVASWLRLDEAGAFTGFTALGRQSHDGALRLAHVTSMIDAEFMRRYVGHWDCVRFGADGEMLERLEHLLCDEVLRLRQLSVLSLDTPHSLTNDAVHGVSKTSGLSAARRGYRDAWREWHKTLTPGHAFIEFPQHVRPFAAPKECVVPSAAIDLVCTSKITSQGFVHDEETIA